MSRCANINYARRIRIFSLESFFQDVSNGLGHVCTISFYLGAMEPLKFFFFFLENGKIGFSGNFFFPQSVMNVLVLKRHKAKWARKWDKIRWAFKSDWGNKVCLFGCLSQACWWAWAGPTCWKML